MLFLGVGHGSIRVVVWGWGFTYSFGINAGNFSINLELDALISHYLSIV